MSDEVLISIKKFENKSKYWSPRWQFWHHENMPV